MVKNTALNLLRKRRLHLVSLDEAALDNLGDKRMDLERERQKLADLAEDLAPEERELVFLRFYDEFSLEEIGAILNMPLGTVKSRLHRALARLRKRLFS